MTDDEPKTKDWAVENVSPYGRVRVIEVYRKANAEAFAAQANAGFKVREVDAHAEVVRI